MCALDLCLALKSKYGSEHTQEDPVIILTNICIYIYIYIMYIHTHICTYIYIHTHMLMFKAPEVWLMLLATARCRVLA